MALERPEPGTLDREATRPVGPSIRTIFVPVGWLVVALLIAAAWETAARNRWANPVFIGQPSKIVVDVYALITGDLPLDAAYTTLETVVGFLIAAAAGMLAAFALAQSQIARRVASPYFIALNSLPRVALAPLFLIWFGVGIWSKVVLAGSLTFFVVFANTMAGIESLEADHLLLARLLGASRSQVFTKFVVPAAIPSIFVGLELGFIFGMLGTVAGEMIAGEHGLGVRLTYFAAIFDTNSYFATLVVLTVITTAIAQVFRIVRGRLLTWQSVHITRHVD